MSNENGSASQEEIQQQRANEKTRTIFDQLVIISELPGWRMRHVNDAANRALMFFAEHVDSGFSTQSIAIPHQTLKLLDADLGLEFGKLVDEEVAVTKKMTDVLQSFIQRRTQKKLLKP